MNDIKGKIIRRIDHAYAKYETWWNEKKYVAHDTRVKYMFFRETGSDILIVSFPGFSPKNTARYQYMRSLLPFKCNKLFLLDDFSSNHRGCYMIEDNVEKCTLELISSIMKQVEEGNKKIRLIFIGSSKGGYCALNFSFHIPGAELIIGAPQYYLGTYLDTINTRDNLSFIIGEITEEGKNKLNNRLKEKIRTSPIRPEKVYIHYSKVEHTYNDHIKDMLTDLKSVGISLYEDVHDYPNHGGLKDYFPPFLKKTISKLIQQ